MWGAMGTPLDRLPGVAESFWTDKEVGMGGGRDWMHGIFADGDLPLRRKVHVPGCRRGCACGATVAGRA